jgi:hypothetical protein
VVQVVGCLLCKHEALSSNPQSKKKEEEEEKKRKFAEWLDKDPVFMGCCLASKG